MSNKKSAARMKPKKERPIKSDGKKADDNVDTKNNVVTIEPPSKSDYDAMNNHRSPLASLLRHISVTHTVHSNNRKARKSQRKAKSYLRHGHPLVPALIIMAFVIASVTAITVGNSASTKKSNDTSVSSTSSTASYETTRTQHDALVRTGLFSMMALDDNVTVSELMDTIINPDECVRYDTIKAERDAQKQEEAEAEETQNTNANDSNTTSNNESSNSESSSNNAFTADNATQSSGSLTDEQMNSGKSVIDDAVNQYNQNASNDNNTQ